MKKALFLLMLLITVRGFAQLSVWNVQTVVEPYPTSFYSVWQNNQSSSYVVVNYAGLPTVNYKVRFVLKNASGAELIRTTSPSEQFAAGPAVKTYFASDFLAWSDTRYNSATLEKIVRTNRFPEGYYEERIEILGLDGTVLAQGNANFTIIYPDAPVLLDPVNGISEERTVPVFSWTPVNLPPGLSFKYNLRIVKKYAGQTAAQAMKANSAHHVVDLVNASSYAYPLSALQFENGQEYVWKIQVVDDNSNPLTANDGNSEFWTFTYNNPNAPGYTLPFSKVDLEKNVVWFTDFSQLQVAAGTNDYRLNGSTTLYIRLADGSTKEVQATVNNLRIRKNNYNPFDFLSGGVTAVLPEGTIAKELTGNFFKPSKLTFDTDDGVVIGGTTTINKSGAPLTQENGLLVLPNGRLRGVIQFATNTGSLFSFGNQAVSIVVNKLRATFPDTKMYAEGEAVAFGSTVVAPIKNAVLSEEGVLNGEAEGQHPFTFKFSEPLADKYMITAQGVKGTFSYNLLTNEALVTLPLTGAKFQMNVTGLFQRPVIGTAGFNGKLLYSSLTPEGTGFIATELKPFVFLGTPLPQNNITVGETFVGDVNSVSFDSLVYTENGFDFTVSMGMTYRYPGLKLMVPNMGLAFFKKDGVLLPALSSAALVSENGTPTNRIIEGLTVKFKKVDQQEKLFTGLAEPLGIKFEATAQYTGLPNGTTEALRSRQITTFIFLTPDTLLMRVPDPAVAAATMPITNTIRFRIEKLYATVVGTIVNGAYNYDSDIKTTGYTILPTGVMGTITPTNLHKSAIIKMDAAGRLSGLVQQVLPGWNMSVGKLPLTGDKYNVRYVITAQGRQEILIEGSSRINHLQISRSTERTPVTYTYSILKDAYTQFTGTFENTSSVFLPQADNSSVVKLIAGKLEFTPAGVMIRGRQKLVLGADVQTDVTADSLIFSYTTLRLSGGKAILDNGFAVTADLVPFGDVYGLQNTEYSNRKYSYPADNRITINVPPASLLTANGWEFPESSDSAFINHKQNTATLISKFHTARAGCNPFVMRAGTIDFTLDNILAGSLNQYELSINESAFITIPDRIAMPSLDAAYLQLKNGQQSLVDVSTENGKWRITTKPNGKANAVFPALRFVNGTVPQIPVTLNILVDKTTKEICGGEVSALVPSASSEAFNLAVKDIPVKLSAFKYAAGSSGLYELNFTGRLSVFGGEFTSQNIELKLSSAGMLSGGFELNEAKQFSLKGGNESGRIVLSVNSVRGNIATKLLNFEKPEFTLELPGALQLKLEDGTYKGGKALFTLTQSGLSYPDYTADDFSTAPKLDFGRVKFAINKFRISSLDYKNGAWKYAVAFDAVPYFALKGFAFSAIKELQEIRISDNLGLEIPQSSVSLTTAEMPTIPVDGFALMLTSYRTNTRATNSIAPDAVNVNNLGFSFSWRVKFPEFPATVSGSIINLQPSATTTIKDDVLSGSISSNKLYDAEIPFGSNNSAFLVSERVTGTLLAKEGQQGINLFVEGKVRVARNLNPVNVTKYIEFKTGTKFAITSKAILSGSAASNAINSSPIDLNIASAKLTANNFKIDFTKTTNSKQVVSLSSDVTATAQINTGVNLTGAGRGVKINLVTGNITEGAILFTNASVQLPRENPLFIFTTPSLALNNTGYVMNGAGKVTIGGSQNEAVMSAYTLNMRTYEYVSGQISIPSSFALIVNTSAAGTVWSTENTNFTINKPNSVGFVVPANSFTLTNSFTISKVGAGKTLAGTGSVIPCTVTLPKVPTVQFPNLSVSNGSLEFFSNNFKNAFLDSTGLTFRNQVAEIPERLKLESETIAYLQLRQGTNKNVTVTPDGDLLRLTTTGDQKVPLVIPGLKYSSSEVPAVSIPLDITVNPSNWQVVKGVINYQKPDGSAIKDLSGNGIPFKVMAVAFKKGEFGYRFSVSGSTIIPAPLAELNQELTNIEFLNGKLSGNYGKGIYYDEVNTSAGYLKSGKVGDNTTFKLQAVSYDFDTPGEYKISGDITNKLFAEGTNQVTAFHYTAIYNNSQKKFLFTLTSGSENGIKIDKMLFRPEATQTAPAASLTFTDNDFILLTNGSLNAPSISNQFAVSLSNIKITKAGVTFQPSSLTGDKVQTFTMFGSEFTIKDVSGKQAINAAYANNILTLTLNGSLAFLGKTIVYNDLQVNSKGEFKIGDPSGSLVKQNAPVVILNDRFRVSKLEITSGSEGKKLKVGSQLQLPKPASSDWINYSFEIPSGQNTAEESVFTVLNESPGLGNDNTEWDFWAGKFDVQNITLKLNYSEPENSEIQLVSEFYVDGMATEHNIRFGSVEGDEVTPGLAIKFDNTNTWVEELEFSDNLEFSYNNLRYNLDSEGIEFEGDDAGGFTLTIDGETTLDMSGMFSGSIKYSGLEVSSENKVSRFTESITGGTITYKQLFTITLEEFKLITRDTVLTVPDPSGELQKSGPEQGQPIMIKQRTGFYLKLAGEFNMKELLSGSVKSLLVYRKKDADGRNGDVNFIVDDLAVKQGDNFEFMLSLAAQTSTGNDIAVTAAGMARINDKYEFVATGKFSNIGGKISAGLFLAMTDGLKIQVGAVTITGLGGGFYWNPNDADLIKVKTYCGFEEGSETKKLIAGAPPGSSMQFAIFLYGTAVLGDKGLVEGRVLLTITDVKLMVDGKITLLERKEEMFGVIHIEVGFKSFYATGTLDVNVLVQEGFVFKANAKLIFFYYSKKNWGVVGNAEMALLGSLMKGSGELYAGSKGFFVSVSFSQEMNIWVVSVKNGLALKMWYKPSVSWGAYFHMYIDASILGGVARARGDIKGVLIGKPEFCLAGGASLRVSLLFISWNGNVWVRMKKSGVAAGFGKDSEVDRLIAQAENMSNDMLDEVKSAQDSMTANKPIPDLTFSDETIQLASSELARIMIQARSLSESKKLPQADRDSIKQWKLDETELQRKSGQTTGSIFTYMNTLESSTIDTYGDNARTELTAQLNVMNATIRDYKNAIKQASRELNKMEMQTEMPELEDAGSAEDPVSNFVFTGVPKPSEEPGPDAPGFEVNDEMATNNLTKVNNYLAKAEDYHNILKRNIEKIDAAIANFDAVFQNPDNSLIGVGKKYVELESKVAEYHKMLSTYFMNDIKTTTANRQSLKNSVNDFLSAIEQVYSTNAANAKANTYRRWARVRKLSGGYQKPWESAEFDTAWKAWKADRQKDESKQKANALYVTIPGQALDSVIITRKLALAEVASVYANNMEEINALSAAYTEMMDELFDKRRKMAENLLEVTERLIYWKDRPKLMEQDLTVTLKNLPPTLETLRTKRTALVTSNTAPVVTVNQPTYQNRNAYTEYSFSWSSPDANRIVEYVIESKSTGANYEYTVPAHSIGTSNAIKGYEFHDTTGIHTRNLRFVLKARSISGYMSYNQVLIPGVQLGYTEASMNTTPPQVSAGSFIDITKPVLESARPEGLLSVAGKDTAGTYNQFRDYTYITAKTGEFRLKMKAEDPESGINTYEYRIQKRNDTKLLETVRDWTSVGSINDILIQGLNLEQGERYTSSWEWADILKKKNLTRYWVSVRAKNGAGLVSNQKSFFLVIDTTKPPAPTFYKPTFTPSLLTAMISSAHGSGSLTQKPLPAALPSDIGKYVLFPLSQRFENSITDYIYRIYIMPEDISISDDYLRDKDIYESLRYTGTPSRNQSVKGKLVFIPAEYADRTEFKLVISAVSISGAISESVESNIYVAPYAMTKDDKSPASGQRFTEYTTESKVLHFNGIPDGRTGNIPSGNMNLYFQRPGSHSTGILKYQYALWSRGKYSEWRDMPPIPQDRIIRLLPEFFTGTESWLKPGDAFETLIKPVTNNLTVSNYTLVMDMVKPMPTLTIPEVTLEETKYSSGTTSAYFGITVNFASEIPRCNKTYIIKTQVQKNGKWFDVTPPYVSTVEAHKVYEGVNTEKKAINLCPIPGKQIANKNAMPARQSIMSKGKVVRINMNENWRVVITAKDDSGNICEPYVKEIIW